jgi:uncharacterized protein YdeI (YjbR/CyaY-like superfamily)
MEEKHTWDKINQWEVEIEILRLIIAKTELVETIKWGGLIYTYNNKNVLGIGGFKSYFGIWFHNGVFLKDEANVLVNAQEGVTKALRQWRFNSKNEINEKLILHYIAEAIQNEKEGKVHKPVKKQEIVSAFLNQKLKENKTLDEAFKRFTPSCQREFIEYIETAKQEKTKESRMEKINLMILNNIGLNDKYK